MLKVHSITRSFSGEIGGFPQGSIVDIIRLSGCNLRCPYCDAKEALDCIGCRSMTNQRIIDKIPDERSYQILITGGEPLLQMEGIESFCENYRCYTCQVETNGTIIPSIKLMNRIAYWVFDYKLDFSDKMILKSKKFIETLAYMRGKLYIKFVVSSKNKMETALKIANSLHVEYRYSHGIEPIIAFSPDVSKISHKEVYDFINENNPSIVLNCQLHKVLGKLENTIFS